MYTLIKYFHIQCTLIQLHLFVFKIIIVTKKLCENNNYEF